MYDDEKQMFAQQQGSETQTSPPNKTKTISDGLGTKRTQC